MWHLEQIPRQLHVYWGGHRLSYLRYLTIHTFQMFNPDWKICLHVPRVISDAAPAWPTFQQKDSHVQHDYMDKVTADIQVHDFADYAFDDHAHEVHKSDFLRWKLLSEQGGVWSDMDIVYVRSMSNLVHNQPHMADIDSVLCPLMPPRKHTVGFLMTSALNDFACWMHHRSRMQYDPAQYQCMGSDILNDNFAGLEDFGRQFPQHRFLFLDRNSIYAVTSKDLDRFYRPMAQPETKKLNSAGVIGFHWFGGHPHSQQFENALTEHNRDTFDHFLGRIIQKVMT